jgi:predicted nucleotidyltransferase
MASIVGKLNKKGLCNPPKWLPNGIQYEVMMGSTAYGVSSDNSDIDVYGFCIPKKDVIFPHLRGVIQGFGKKEDLFEQYQQHHIDDKSNGKQYDLTIFNIVKYFNLAMDNNPNIIDSLFVPDRCVLHVTNIGNMVRQNRHLFLHKGSYHKLKGYAYSQLHKAEIKNPQKGSKRADNIEKFGWDVKFGYHVVRLLNQCEQILIDHDLDLEKNKEQLKSVRRGEMTYEDVRELFSIKERELEKLYINSTLRNLPDEVAIKQLLIDCLEEHYGNLSECVVNVDRAVDALRKINDILKNNEKLL